MPEHPDVMSVDAKIEHHFFPTLIDVSGAAVEEQPALFDPDRIIVIVSFHFEVNVKVAASTCTLQLGITGTSAKFATIAVNQEVAGVFVEGTVLAAGKDIAAGTRIVGNHVLLAQVGDGYLHVFYYRKSNKPTEVVSLL